MPNHINRKNEEAESNIIQQFISKYLPYWPILSIAILLGLICSYFYIRYTIPLYQATATIIIKDEKKGTEDSKLTESLNTISSKQLLENEIEVIKSRSLMEDVVDQLFLYAPLSQKGRVNYTSAYLSSPIEVQALYPDSLKEANKISISYDKSTGFVEINHSGKYKINEFVTTPYGLLKFTPNPNYNSNEDPPNDLYFSIISPKKITQTLLKQLEVTAASKLSTIIEIKLKDEVPERAENILNSLVRAYDQAGLKTKKDLAKNTLIFVEERLNEVGNQIDSIQRKVGQYKSSVGAVDIGTQGQLFLQNVSENDQKLSTVNTQINVLSQVEKYVTSKNNDNAIVPSTFGVNDPMLTQLLDKLYNSELEYEKLKKTVGENHPKLVALTDQINKIRPNILDNIRSQKQSLLETRKNISATNGSYNSMLRSMPGKEKALLELTRDQTTLNGIYQFLLQKREESALAVSSTISDNKIVDNAQSDSSPVSPNKKVVYAAFVMGFLILSLLVITIKELFTGKILYRKEIEGLTNIPIVAEIAQNPKESGIIIEPGKRNQEAEEFRKIRISLSYLGIDAKHNKILITSSISGEGKSFIATNLAISISSTGKKVVLVDMDFNNPSTGKLLNIEKSKGVTDFLMGNKNPQDIITQLPEYQNLYYISSGTMVDGPTELLANGKISTLIQYLQTNFDTVIIDTSPVLGVTDGYLLSGLCDSTLYIVRHNYTPRIIIKRLDQTNIVTPLHNPAIIFNGIKTRGFFSNTYGYGYGYQYVYGYNKNTQKSK